LEVGVNSRERFLKSLLFGAPDRPFEWQQIGPWGELCIWHETLDRWRREGLPPDVHVQAYFGYERKEVAPIATGMMPGFEPETIEETADHQIIVDGSGVKKKVLKTGESMPQFLDFPVKTRADFERMKSRYNHASPARYPLHWEDLKRSWAERDFPLGISCPGFFGTVRGWMGCENCLLAFHDDPALIGEMMEFIAEFDVQLIRRALGEVSFDYAVFWEDMAFKTGPLISPRHFKQFMVPAYRRVVDELRKSGIEIIMVDSDGNINELIPLWLEAGVNCFWPLEVAAGMDPVALRKRYGKDAILVGAIDKRALSKDKRAVEREVMSKVPQLIDQGGYLPCIDHHIPPDVPLENYQYYLSLVRRIGENG
jgi:uroporphyrinogen decarboxylase